MEVSSTGGPRYSRTFYLRTRLFTFTKLVKNDNFLVKNGLFICERREFFFASGKTQVAKIGAWHAFWPAEQENQFKCFFSGKPFSYNSIFNLAYIRSSNSAGLVFPV